MALILFRSNHFMLLCNFWFYKWSEYILYTELQFCWQIVASFFEELLKRQSKFVSPTLPNCLGFLFIVTWVNWPFNGHILLYLLTLSFFHLYLPIDFVNSHKRYCEFPRSEFFQNCATLVLNNTHLVVSCGPAGSISLMLTYFFKASHNLYFSGRFDWHYLQCQEQLFKEIKGQSTCTLEWNP